MGEKAMQNADKLLQISKIAALIVGLLLIFCSGLVLGAWQQTEKFKYHLEKISDINQCYDNEL